MKIVVLASGNGSNLQAILDACANQLLTAQVVAVITNKVEAYALQRAHHANISAVAKIPDKHQSRQMYDAELAQLIQSYQPDVIVLAGWMRLLSHAFLQHFPRRVINLHPALPDMFPGLYAIERAFSAYQKGEITHTGVMVHYVPDEGVDCGPVIVQQEVPIYKEDSLETLTIRIHQTEHKLLLQALQKIASNFNLIIS